MHSSDEDEDVKQAIALSLGNEYQPISGSSSKVGETTAVPGKESVIVDLCDDTDASDNELTAVLPVKGTTHPVPISADTGDRNGKEEIEQSPVAGPDQAIHGLPEDAGPSLDSKDTGSTTKSLLQTLNRKQMEEERLARRKRKASVSPPGLRRKKLTQDSDIEVLSEKRRKAVNKEENEQIQEPVLQGVSTGTGPLLGLSPSSTSGIQYPQGVVRKTWAFGYAREEDIKIEEVLQKKDLSIAVLSAFQWDVEWLLHKLDLNKTKIIFVMQAKDEATKTRYRSEIAGMGNLRLCFPSMAGNVNCMHSKLQLLFHPTYLRVVVPSANLTSYDWGEAGGVMENMVFLVDLPRLKEPDQPVKKVKENLTFFGQELVYFLEAMGLEADVIKGVLQFDFSATKDLAFVHSIGGPHAGEAWRRTGYCGLGTAVQRLGLACQDPLDIDFVTSSVGSLKFDFLYAIYLAAQGDDGLKEYDIRTAPRPTARNKDAIAARDQLVQQEKRLLETVKQGFRIFFPTRDTVVESKGGPASGGTICLQSKWYDAQTFPRELFRDCRSRRPGMLMHNKLLYARPRTSGQSSSDKQAPCWAYIGSANLSESAWGRLVKDKTSKQPKLNCRNWECGVIVRASIRGAHSSLEPFGGHVPVPMEHPGEQYGSRRPWFYAHADS